MERTTTVISPEEIAAQLEHCDAVRRITDQWPQRPLAFVDTYGCQQNEADSERIRGYLERMGFGFTEDEEQARIIVINTCAIREHAEQRVFGNVGALVHVKRRHPEQLICLCGCMVQRPEVAEKLRASYRHVDLVFGPHALWQFPEMIHTLLSHKGRMFRSADDAPLLGISGHTVRITPGLASVERQLAAEAVRATGLELREEPFGRNDLPHLDELFFVDHRGVTALSHCDGQPLMTLLSERIAEALEGLFPKK